LKTAARTTRSPAYLWYPEQGELAHAAYGARIEPLGGNYNPQGGGCTVLSLNQITRMWRVITTTALGGITSDNLAASMGSKNGAVDVFALGSVLNLPFLKNDGDGSVSLLVCIAELIHRRHTDKDDLKNVLTSFVGCRVM
jgi:hypothetical protein